MDQMKRLASAWKNRKPLSSAWKNSDIKFEETTIGADKNIRTASFDGKYICLITDDNTCFILDSFLNKCCEHKLEFEHQPKYENIYHVFAESRGLVLAGWDGEIIIVPFDGWTPKPPIDADKRLKGDIYALSTRDELIIAGSENGEVGGWNFAGENLFRFKLPDIATSPYDRANCIHSISIRKDKFIVGRDDACYEYKIKKSQPINLKKIPIIPALKDDDMYGLDWATYDMEGRRTKQQVLYAKEELFTYRPVLPRHTSQHKVYSLALNPSTNEIVIRDFKTSEYIRTYKHMKKDGIRFMWCTDKQLFLVTSGKTVYMMNFAKGLDQLDCSFKVAECFGLDMFNQR